MKDTRDTAPMADDKIIQLYWERNERALDETDKKYGKYLLTIAYNIVHNEPDSQECLNDTYLGTWNKIPPSRPNVFQVFLSKIMRNIAVSKFRENNAKKRVPSEMMTSLSELDECIKHPSTVEEEFQMSELRRILNSFLRSLTPRSEFVFVCRYYYCDTISRIASMLQLSENTIYRELATIREELRKLLIKEGYAYEDK